MQGMTEGLSLMGFMGHFITKDFCDIILLYYWTVNPLKVHDLILISEYDVVSGI